MYKLLHKLFGWDYIHWRNSADQGVARVFCLPDGSVGYWRYAITECLDIITDSTDVTWLTCHPSKYFPSK